MRFINSVIILYCLAIMVSAQGAAALSTYDDDTGRFAIDLPKDYRLSSQTGQQLFIFQGEGPQVMLLFESEAKELKKAGMVLVETMKKNMKTEGTLLEQSQESEINGVPGQWKISKGVVADERSKVTVDLYAISGSVLLKDGALSLMAFYSPGQRAREEAMLKDVILSMRNAGTAVKTPPKSTEPPPSETTTVRAASTGTRGSTHVAAEMTVFKKNGVTIQLPEGWSESPLPPNSPKEHRVAFTNTGVPGSRVVVLVFGTFVKLKDIPDVMRSTVSQVQEAKRVDGPKGPVQPSGASYEVYSAYMIVEGAKRSLTYMIAWRASAFGNKYGVLAVLPGEPNEALKADFVAMIGSLK